jgi:hypothetical protein
MALLTKHLMEDPVPPSVRRPDLNISPEMDAMVLKALEKDRDHRYQNMGEFLAVASACPGPDGDATRPSMGGFTRELGGGNAKAETAPGLAAPRAPTKVGNVSERTAHAELVSNETVDAAAAARPRSPVADKSIQKMVLAAIGVALGVFAALYLMLSRGKTSTPAPVDLKPAPAVQSQPVPPVAPVPATPPAVPTPVQAAAPPATPPAPAAEAETAAAASRGPAVRKAKTHASTPTGKAIAPALPPPLPRPAPSRTVPPPADLKPFPGM